MNMLIFQNLDINISGVVPTAKLSLLAYFLAKLLKIVSRAVKFILTCILAMCLNQIRHYVQIVYFGIKWVWRVKQESLGVTVKKQFVEQLYTVEPVDDIHSFRSLSQIIP